jgi:hypothetical protein
VRVCLIAAKGIGTSREIDNSNIYIAVGAAWMHETSQNNLVKLIPKLGIDYYYDDGMAMYLTEHGRAGSQFKVCSMITTIRIT